MIKSVREQAAVYTGLVALLAVPFLADLLLPLGTAVWVIYLLPIALSYATWKPQVPPLLATAATVLVFVGYLLAPVGVDPEIAQINRILGLATAWVVAAIGFFFITNKLKVQKQDWIQAGHVGLAAAMAGEQRVEELGANILRFVSNYVGAQAGAFFVENGRGYERAATVGVPADAPIPERVAAGEGLLGEAIAQRRLLSLDRVPDNLLYLGSALSRGKPGQLAIVPAEIDEHVIGVLELGFLGNSFVPHRDFLASVAPAIAVAVRSAKYRNRLQSLLEETQQQAEELQAQSEELRAANEELEQQSRNLQASQAELENQQHELEETNARLEAQTHLLETQRDDLNRAQEALEARSRELEQASRYKSEFLANMSHELRTPLNSLLIMARLLADNRNGTLNAEEIRYAETIESSGNDLLALINDVLDISKIEAGHVEVRAALVSVAETVQRLETTFGPLAAEKGLQLKSEIAPEAVGSVETDPQRLEQILKNFLSNALKFTERGEVVLEVSAGDDGHLVFAVKDSGIGIPRDKQETIFDAFQQVDGTISRKYGGTGLGLSISRELARLLGGEISLESEPGQGSTFSLSLPRVYDRSRVRPRHEAGAAAQIRITRSSLRTTEPPASPAGPVHRTIEDDRERLTGSRRTILIVEDDETFARILYDLAHELGFQCIITGSADEAVLAARQYMPHGIVLDIGLPDHSGLTVLDRLKRDPRIRHVPVHVVSVDDYAQTAMSWGAAGYMLKPVRREELTAALQGLEESLSQRMRRVLVVEDNADQLDSICLLLKSSNVETIGVRSAGDCLERLRTETYDCIVLDLSLPDVSGFDLLEQLSRSENHSFPPVIVYTGRDLSADEELRLRKFSKSIIIKGAKSPERLLDEVTLFLHQMVSDLSEKHQRLLSKALNRDAALEGRRILVAEDDVRNVFAVTSIFEPHGARIEIARNGREALEKLAQQENGGGNGAIDLVLMDIMMPEMDGLTAIREIRKKPEWRDLPIIALTAKAMPADQEQCLAAGANDYVAKPLNVEKLLSLARVWMPR